MEFTLLYLSLISLLIFLPAVKVWPQTRSRRKGVPPILGYLHLLKEPLHRTLLTLSEKYGSVFSLRFGSRNVVVVSSPSAVEECFNKNDIVFANRPRLIMGRYLAYNNTTVGLVPYSDHWRNLRRLCTVEILSSSRLNMFLGIRRDEIKMLLGKLNAVSSNGFANVEMRPMFSELKFNFVMRMMAGKRYYCEQDGQGAQGSKGVAGAYIEEVFECGGASDPADFLPILEWFDYQGLVKRVMSLGKKMDSFLQALIDEHRSTDDHLQEYWESNHLLLDCS